MKKVFFTALATIALLVAFAGNSQAQNGNSIENRVRAAAMPCVNQYNAPHSTVELSLISTGRCIDGGTVYVYDVWVVYQCPPNLLCFVIAPVLAARVTTDCDGRIATVECY